jgi:hypothetical protein
MPETDFIAIAAGTVPGTVTRIVEGDDGTEVQMTDELTDQEWLAKVESRALDLAVMSHQSRALDVVSKALSKEDTKKWKTFTGVIDRVTKEQSSTRGRIFLKTRPSERNPEGKEDVRTGRTDSSQSARDLANKAVALTGHRIQLFVELEPKNDGSGESVRIVHHIVDLGAVDDD